MYIFSYTYLLPKLSVFFSFPFLDHWLYVGQKMAKSLSKRVWPLNDILVKNTPFEFRAEATNLIVTKNKAYI